MKYLDAVEANEPAPPCRGCGGPHRFDTTVPSPTWNKVIRARGLPEYLCLSCIVCHFAEIGHGFTAQLWGGPFGGTPISVHIEGKIATASAELVEQNNDLRAELERCRLACHCEAFARRGERT